MSGVVQDWLAAAGRYPLLTPSQELDLGHKIQRGFEPVLTYSNHWIADERLREAVAQFAGQEADQVRAYQRNAATLLPFKRGLDQS